MNIIKWELMPEEGENLNIYIGHTNFEIKREHIKILDEIEGVEAVNIPSRYRFILFVGQCFSWKKIKSQIEQAFGCSDKLIRPEMAEIAIKKYGELEKMYKFWVAYIFPNENVIIKHANTFEEILPQLNNLKELKNLSGGILMVPKSIEDSL